MNILILNWRDPKHPLAGGAEQSLQKHADFWRKKGAKVTWFSSRFPGAKKEEEINGIKIIRRGSHYTVHLFAFIENVMGLFSHTNVVIDCFHFVPFFTPLYKKKSKIIGLINEPAKNAWFENIFFPLNLFGYILEPFFFLVYQNVPFITSAASISEELEHLGIKKKNIHIISHGVSVHPTSHNITRKVNAIVFVAQLSPDKGILDAIAAFSILKKKQQDLKLWVVGKAISKSYESKIKDYIKSLQLEKYVTFYGYVGEKKKFELMSRAFVLVHASVREGWGLTVIEANAMGTPAVGYNVTGLRDSIRDKETGFLTRKNTPEELANAILTILNDEKLYKKLSNNAIMWAKNFSWERSGEKSWYLIQNIYNEKK